MRLPSLTALRSFEAAARLGSMTKAAEELCVTHGAVSRQVQALEADLGIKLLNRLARSLETTEEGEALAKKLSHAFALMGDAVSSLKPGPVVLSCSASLTMRWLIPRLPLFKAAHPDITLQLSASHGPVDFLRENVDIAIRNDVVRSPANVSIERLGQEYFGPVCSPDYARQNKIGTPSDLARCTILATMTRPAAWREWCAAIGQDITPDESRRDVYEHFYVMIQASLCGLGVAIAPRILVEDDIRSGALVAPFGFVPGNRNLEFWTKDDARRKSGVKALREWLKAQVLEIYDPLPHGASADAAPRPAVM